MSGKIDYRQNKATGAEITKHLANCDSDFIPPLGERVVIADYVRKITDKSVRFEAWDSGLLIGLVAAYCNDSERGTAFITTVSVLQGWRGIGIASCLIKNCIDHLKMLRFSNVELEVDSGNIDAMSLYRKIGFVNDRNNGNNLVMKLDIERDTVMNNQRDYNSEIKDASGHQYAYSFDFDVMHPYMIRSFEPFFLKGSLLELGSFKGDFTKRFLSYFDDVTCVEASGDAIKEAKSKLGDKVKFVHAVFEKAELPRQYDNIVLTHVLEHIDDPILVLKRINDEWLAKGGRLFLVCPNANAPSRQIAVKMGLITHNAAVTSAESAHGHRCTYSLDTLERDAVAAGLKVTYRSGIFFKALANFQWDRLLNTDIISKEYLEGCYKLGQQYPDLCSSIFLMCERS